MKRNTLEKEAGETFEIYGDFTKELSSPITGLADDTIDISSTTITAVDKDGVDATATVLTAAGKRIVATNYVGVWCKAGIAAGSPYIISFKMVTAGGANWQVDVEMTVN